MNAGLTRLRPAPPFTLAAALLLWGWQTGFLLFAIPMLVILELTHWIRWRWPVTDKEFNLLADVSGLGFFIVVVYIFTSEGARGIFVILSVMPFVLFPLVIVQYYSDRGRVGLASLFVSLRRLDPVTTPEAGAEIDLSLPYLLLCIISASSGNIRTDWFYILVFLLLSIILWFFRPTRYPIATWVGMLLLAFSLGYATQEGLRDLQRALESTLIGMFDQFMWRYRDPERATTAIGTIGRLKLSDRVVIRVKPDEELQGTLLLHEASYQRYNYGVWSNTISEYTVIDPELDGSIVLDTTAPERSAVISNFMPREVGVIPLPHGSTRISDVVAVEVNRNQYNTIKMEIREGWIDYRVDYQGQIRDSTPEPEDLDIPDPFREDFNRLVNDLGLDGLPPDLVLARVKSFFNDDFTYSLNQRGRYPRGRYLHNFLFNEQSGHCEYFATSTVMLLRAAGIPARYAVGYAIDEYSKLEGQYVARSRDAHSWAMAYIDGNWQVVDTTPSVWAAYEDANASSLEPLMDLLGWISYRISVFQTRDELEQEEANYNLLYLLIPLLLILAWRLFFKERIRRKDGISGPPLEIYRQGTDSHFYALVGALNQAGYIRRKGESPAVWLKRVNEVLHIEGLDQVLALHYRYRFDPAVQQQAIKQELQIRVESILETGLKPNVIT